MDVERFQQILRDHKRVAIVGGPRTGKSTLSALADRPVVHTDDTMDLPWEDQPSCVIQLLRHMDTFVVEGVQASRAIRKGLEVDAVVELTEPFETLNQGQASMHKSHQKIMGDVLASNPNLKVYR